MNGARLSPANALHDGHKVASCTHRATLALCHDARGDASRGSLFAEVAQRLLDLCLSGGGEVVGGGFAVRGVETHVEQFIAIEREATVGGGELIGRQPEVHQDAVDIREAEIAGDGINESEVCVYEVDPVAEE